MAGKAGQELEHGCFHLDPPGNPRPGDSMKGSGHVSGVIALHSCWPGIKLLAGSTNSPWNTATCRHEAIQHGLRCRRDVPDLQLNARDQTCSYVMLCPCHDALARSVLSASHPPTRHGQTAGLPKNLQVHSGSFCSKSKWEPLRHCRCF